MGVLVKIGDGIGPSHSPVITKMILPPEPLAADVTRERSLVCVRPLVDQQVVRLSEVAATKTANVLLPGSAKPKGRGCC